MLFSSKQSYSDILSYVLIIVLFIATFFGTKRPFPEGSSTVEDIGTSNITNQLVYGSLFVSSLLLLLKNRAKVLQVILKEKFLTLFFIWCLIGIYWSDLKFETFKAVFRLATVYMVLLSFFAHHGKSHEILKYLKVIIYLFVIMNLMVIFLVPAAKDPQFMTWRGMTDHKNQLGQVSMMCILFSLIFFGESKVKKEKSIALLFAFLSMTLLLGSRSSTAIITLGVIICIIMMGLIDTYFKPLRIGKFASVFTIFTFGITIILYYVFDPTLLDSVASTFGKDTTFTGRVELWEAVLFTAQKHIVIGGGLGAFWTPQNPLNIALYEVFIWLPKQAHNGYIDLLNDTGIIGLILFFSIIIRFFYHSIKIQDQKFWILLVISILILNIQETTFISPGSPVAFSLMFAYLYTEFKFFFERNSNNLQKHPQ